MNFCNKHQVHFDIEKECNYCTGRDKRGHWPHQPTSEQLTLELIQNRVNTDLMQKIIDEHDGTFRKLADEGLKHDQEKPDLSLLPREFLEEVAKAFMHGERKYGRYNYKNGLSWHRVIAASLRHISAFNEGENTDSESGLSHLSHAGACIAMLIVYYKGNLGTDTRYKGAK